MIYRSFISWDTLNRRPSVAWELKQGLERLSVLDPRIYAEFYEIKAERVSKKPERFPHLAAMIYRVCHWSRKAFCPAICHYCGKLDRQHWSLALVRWHSFPMKICWHSNWLLTGFCSDYFGYLNRKMPETLNPFFRSLFMRITSKSFSCGPINRLRLIPFQTLFSDLSFLMFV